MKSIALILGTAVGLVFFGWVALWFFSNRAEEQRLWGFINAQGEIVIPIEFDDVADYSNGLAAVREGELWGFIDRDGGQYAIPPRFPRVGPFTARGLAVAADSESGLVGYIDRSGAWAIEPRFHDAADFEDEVAFASITIGIVGGSGNLSSTRIVADGLIDERGEWMVAPIEDIDGEFWRTEGPFRDGLGAVTLGRRGTLYGFVDRSGSFVVEPRYSWVRAMQDGWALARRPDETYEVVGADGSVRFDFRGEAARRSDDGQILLYGATGAGEGWFVLSPDSGLILAGPIAADHADLPEGRFIPIAERERSDGTSWLVTFDGEKIAGPWDSTGDVSEGLVSHAVSDGRFFGDYLWGFADTGGRVVVQPRFDRARPFHEGRAAVALRAGR